VNVVLPPDVSILTRIKNRPNECRSLHYFECPCMFSLNKQETKARSINTIKRWNKAIEQVVNLPEFHNRNVRKFNVFKKFKLTSKNSI
jgi:hypothetical protein